MSQLSKSNGKFLKGKELVFTHPITIYYLLPFEPLLR